MYLGYLLLLKNIRRPVLFISYLLDVSWSVAWRVVVVPFEISEVLRLPFTRSWTFSWKSHSYFMSVKVCEMKGTWKRILHWIRLSRRLGPFVTATRVLLDPRRRDLSYVMGPISSPLVGLSPIERSSLFCFVFLLPLSELPCPPYFFPSHTFSVSFVLLFFFPLVFRVFFIGHVISLLGFYFVWCYTVRRFVYCNTSALLGEFRQGPVRRNSPDPQDRN